MTNFAVYAKAITGAVVAALAVLATSLDDGSLSTQEGIYAAIAFVTGLGAVYAIPNRDPQATHQQQSVQPPERGNVDVVTVLVVVVLVVLLLVLLGWIR